MTNTVQNLTIKSVDGVLGTRTQRGRMVGADESTGLRRHSLFRLHLQYKFSPKNVKKLCNLVTLDGRKVRFVRQCEKFQHEMREQSLPTVFA